MFPKRKIVNLLLVIFLVLLFNEFLIYYVVLYQCHWPGLRPSDINVPPLRALIMADPHLLGPRKGHWFDKLRREWQMRRAFQTAITLHRPEVVFVLGDLFDEGLMCSTAEFKTYVKRFKDLFSVPDATQMYVVAGNHDMGFHYEIILFRAERFIKEMNTEPVSLVTIRDVHFVLVNSMAMEGDGCDLCYHVEMQLNNISARLKCAKGIGKCYSVEKVHKYSRPVLLQHFPLYRPSDASCNEWDSAPLKERSDPFRERFHCLSREGTEQLQESLRFRAAFSGHTHHGCVYQHRDSIEYSVASFSWRNRNNPSFILAEFTPDDYKIFKCAMPQESTVIILYAVLGLYLVVYAAKTMLSCRFNYRKKKSYH